MGLSLAWRTVEGDERRLLSHRRWSASHHGRRRPDPRIRSRALERRKGLRSSDRAGPTCRSISRTASGNTPLASAPSASSITSGDHPRQIHSQADVEVTSTSPAAIARDISLREHPRKYRTLGNADVRALVEENRADANMENGFAVPSLTTVLRLAVARRCRVTELVSVFDKVEDLAALLPK